MESIDINQFVINEGRNVFEVSKNGDFLIFIFEYEIIENSSPMRKILFYCTLIACLVLISGCSGFILVDYNCCHSYVVENRLSRRIVVYHEEYYSYKKTSDTIPPMKSLQVYFSSEKCGKNSIPGQNSLPFDSIEVYYNDTIHINRDFMKDSLWLFTSGTYRGRYLLVIDSTLLVIGKM